VKQKINAYVFMEHGYQENANGRMDYSAMRWAPSVWKCRVPDEDSRVFIGMQIVEVETPDDFNPVPAQVAALEREKLAALEAYQKSVADINERLSKLLAITNDVEATPNEEADFYAELERGYAQDRI
jgi:hypothetical protein